MMELLLESMREFGDINYWNCFFQQRGAQTFGWYGSFSDIKELLLVHLNSILNGRQRHDISILNLGNRRSALAVDIVEELKFPRIKNVYLTDIAVDEMRAISPQSEYPLMERVHSDMRKKRLLDLVDAKHESTFFDAVLDEAFLDAFMACQYSNCNDGPPVETISGIVDKHRGNFDPTKEAHDLLESLMGFVRPGGVYILISLFQSYIVKELTRYLLYSSSQPSNISSVTIYPFRTSNESIQAECRLHPYLVVLKKGAKGIMTSKLCCHLVPHSPQDMIDLLEESFPVYLLPRKIQKLSNTRQLSDFVKTWRSCQSHQLHLFESSQLTSSKYPDRSKYSITLYDNKKAVPNSKPTVAIIVPVGQETDWLYQTVEGNQHLADKCNATRLLLITFGLGFQSPKLTQLAGNSSADSSAKLFREISSEISPYLKQLALNSESTIPVMAITEYLGGRNEIASVKSKYADTIFVYDYPMTKGRQNGKQLKRKTKNIENDSYHRVMIFSCNPRLIQSEVKVCLKSQLSPKFDFLDVFSGYYEGVIASLGLLPFTDQMKSMNTVDLSCLVLGLESVFEKWGSRPKKQTVALGGGILVNLLKLAIQPIVNSLSLTAVELDPSVVEVAREYFGYPTNDCGNESGFTLRTVIQDGIEYINGMIVQRRWSNTAFSCFSSDLAPESQSFIVVDINSANRESPILCPSQAFLSKRFLDTVKRVLKSDGLLVFNLVTRSEGARTSVYNLMKEKFPFCYEFEFQDDINRIVMCRKFSQMQEAKAVSSNLSHTLEKMSSSCHPLRCVLKSRSPVEWSNKLKHEKLIDIYSPELVRTNRGAKLASKTILLHTCWETLKKGR